MTDKRAMLELSDLIPVGLVLIVGGIILALGAQVTGEVRADHCVDGAAGQYYNETANACLNSTGGTGNVVLTYGFNTSTSALEGEFNLANRMPTIGLVAAIVIVIGLLVSGFGYLMGRR